jgi:hypothetical protein
VHHLSGDEFSDGESDDVRGAVDVSDDAPRLGAGEPVWFGAETEHNLVAVDCVDVEVDGDAGAAGGRDPVEQGPSGFSELVGAERLDAPLGDVREVVIVPRVHPTRATRSGETVAGSNSSTAGSPWPVRVATAIAW